MLRRRRRTQRGRTEADLGRDVRPIADPKGIARLVAEARAESLETYVYTLLGLDAGLRLGEACGLRWGSVVWGAGEDDTSRCLRIVESRPRLGLPRLARATPGRSPG
jgi:integrase